MDSDAPRHGSDHQSLLSSPGGSDAHTDRTSRAQAALECFHLQQTILDLNAAALKHAAEMKTQKNLLRNLQKLVKDVEDENKARTKDNLQYKARCADLEKKLQEATANGTMLGNQLNRNKKVMGSMQTRISNLEKEKKALEVARYPSPVPVPAHSRACLPCPPLPTPALPVCLRGVPLTWVVHAWPV